ncbi:MAG: FAD-dependent oxidoreductase [Verrucomicrobiota bacterium]|nr:FAD-dependent oxidoreductase [Verrucomicrobiota bacterium]
MGREVIIVGQGLAGTCLAWRLWDRARDFSLVHRGDRRSTSFISAGLLTPVTGRNLNPSWRLEEFLSEARAFYQGVEMVLGEQFFHEIPIVRLFADADERSRFDRKREVVDRWVAEFLEPENCPYHAPHGGVIWQGGGWLDTRRFLEASRGYFREAGLIKVQEVDLEKPLPDGDVTVLCAGAAGLGAGPFGFLPERRAKGELLTVRILGFPENRIVSRNGWLVPLGGGLFRAGATYSWDDLTDTTTRSGRAQIEELIGSFTSLPCEVLEHVAGVRPIVRQRRPVIGRHPEIEDLVIFNGLGSKGVLYAPGVAGRLASHLCEGTEIEKDLNVSAFAE